MVSVCSEHLNAVLRTDPDVSRFVFLGKEKMVRDQSRVALSVNVMGRSDAVAVAADDDGSPIAGRDPQPAVGECQKIAYGLSLFPAAERLRSLVLDESTVGRAVGEQIHPNP